MSNNIRTPWPSEEVLKQTYEEANIVSLKLLSSVGEEMKALAASLELKRQQVRALQGHLLVACVSSCKGEGCGAWHKIKDLTYIQTQWYTPPRGCSEGDYWNDGDGEFICPSCGCKNRLYNRDWYNQLKHAFANVVKEHDR